MSETQRAVYSSTESEDRRDYQFPVLSGILRLSDADLSELRRQGFVSQERRGNSVIFKLRYRRAGKQQVRYIGRAVRVAAVQEELDKLQATRQLDRRLTGLIREACYTLKHTKATLQPLLASHGLAFHGHQIRTPRQRKITNTVRDP